METTSEVVAAASEKNKTTSEVEFSGRGGRILGREGGSANLKDGLCEKGELLPHWFPAEKTEAGRTRGGQDALFSFLCFFSLWLKKNGKLFACLEINLYFRLVNP